MGEHFDTVKANKAQEEFCKSKDIPHFAPSSTCWHCGRNIYDKISVEKASNRLITSCPYCHKSFWD